MSRKKDFCAFDASLTLVLLTIDQVLQRSSLPWEAVALKGYTCEILQPHRKDQHPLPPSYEEAVAQEKDLTVVLHPTSWPEESRIASRLVRSGPEWWPIEGTIVARHIKGVDGPFSYKFEMGNPHYICPRGSGTSMSEILLAAARLHRPDLAGKSEFGL